MGILLYMYIFVCITLQRLFAIAFYLMLLTPYWHTFWVQRKQKSKLITWQQSPFDPLPTLLRQVPLGICTCVCVCEFTPPARRNVASCNIFVASSTDFRSLFHLPNVWHVHSRRCCNCATATARQLDARARRPPEPTEAWLPAISCGSHRLTFWVPQVGPLSR